MLFFKFFEKKHFQFLLKHFEEENSISSNLISNKNQYHQASTAIFFGKI